MSVLVNESFVNPSLALWSQKSLPAAYLRSATTVGSVTIAPSAAGTIGSITFASPVNFVKLKGWINIQTSSTVTGCSLFLSSSGDGQGSSPSADFGAFFNTVSISGSNVNNRFLLDNLYYYNQTPFTTINIQLGRNANGSSQSFVPSIASGSNDYSALPTVSGWQLGLGQTLIGIAGVVN